MNVLQGGVVSTSPNPQAGGPTLVGCPRLLIQFIRSYPPYRRPFLYPQPEDAPCRGDRDPLHLQIILPNFCRNTSVEAEFKTKLRCLQQYLYYISADCNSVCCVVLKNCSAPVLAAVHFWAVKDYSMPCPCRAHAVPMLFPCHSFKASVVWFHTGYLYLRLVCF